MKRILALLLVLVFAMSFSSCGEKTVPDETGTAEVTTAAETKAATEETPDATTAETVDPTVISKTPADEIPTQKTFSVRNDDLILLEITVNGYKSESLGLDFYVKNTEYITGVAKVTPLGSSQVYIWQDCLVGSTVNNELIVHNHAFGFLLTDSTEKRLNEFSPYDIIHEGWFRKIEINSNTSLIRHFYLAAGEIYSIDRNTGKRDSDISIDDYYSIRLYDGIYTDGKCEFTGKATFGYIPSSKETSPGASPEDYIFITCEMAFTVLDCR